jgi:hypothetical protein
MENGKILQVNFSAEIDNVGQIELNFWEFGVLWIFCGLKI